MVGEPAGPSYVTEAKTAQAPMARERLIIIGVVLNRPSNHNMIWLIGDNGISEREGMYLTTYVMSYLVVRLSSHPRCFDHVEYTLDRMK